MIWAKNNFKQVVFFSISRGFSSSFFILFASDYGKFLVYVAWLKNEKGRFYPSFFLFSLERLWRFFTV